MSFLIDCFKGIAIGAGAILPGISSGVLCVIFGIYEKLLDSILNFFHDIKNNTKFLLPITIGIGIGVLIFSNIINFFLTYFPVQTKSVFIGLILGSIPSLIKETNKKTAFKFHYCFYTLFAFIIASIRPSISSVFSISISTAYFESKFSSAFSMLSPIAILFPDDTTTFFNNGIFDSFNFVW